MSEKLVQILADLDRKEVVHLNHVSSEKLIKNLVDAKNEYILLTGALFEQFEGGIIIFSDNDIQSLIESYLYFEEEILTNSCYKNGEYLHDGELSFSAACNGEMVNIEFRYYPQDETLGLVTTNILITSDEYLWWWRSIARGIYNIADSFGLC